MNCVMMVTQACNIKCEYCYMNASKNKNIVEPIEPIIKTIETLETIEIDKLILGGGEPFLRKDVLDILKKSVNKIPTSILTNGTLINEKIVSKLDKIGIQGISISLDSASPEIHNRYRDGTFASAKKSLEICAKEGMDVDMGVCVTKKNFKDTPNLIKMAENINLSSITFEGLNPIGRAQSCQNLGLTPKETDYFLEEMDNYLQDESPDVDVIIFYPQWVRWDKHAPGCEACREIFGLLPNGEILPCTNLPVSLGNILEEDFTDVWNSEFADDIRNKRLGGCDICKYKEQCGGCRSRAYGCGNMFGSDPSCTLTSKKGEYND